MVKETNKEKTIEPGKESNRKQAQKAARKIKNRIARAKAVNALKSGIARRVIKVRKKSL